MQYMNNVLTTAAIPDDAAVAIEYQVPLTSKRVDFILTGADDYRRETAIIVELKQWSMWLRQRKTRSWKPLSAGRDGR